jgi:dihydroflavonol-4-reductase
VTGATGFLGWHVARLLLERGAVVRVLVREPSRLRELNGVEVLAGDLRNEEAVRAAVQGCDAVFHVAADYRLWARHPEELYQSNVDGTRNLMEAALRAAVPRVVYTSTVGCIGIPRDGSLGDENTPVALEEMTGAYKRSKFLAERVALDYAGRGLPVITVNPTAPVGDHDWKPTPTGRIVVDFLKGRMPAYVDTGLNVADARDTAEGHVLAAEKGRGGERYILGSENLTLRGILDRLARISGLPAPRLRIPFGVALAAGYVSTAWAELTGREPRAPLDAVRMARKKMWVSHAKAVRELGWNPAGADVALAKAVHWFRANGYV